MYLQQSLPVLYITFRILVVDDGTLHSSRIVHGDLNVEVVRRDVELLDRRENKQKLFI